MMNLKKDDDRDRIIERNNLFAKRIYHLIIIVSIDINAYSIIACPMIFKQLFAVTTFT
jgi:hypothetical protein